MQCTVEITESSINFDIGITYLEVPMLKISEIPPEVWQKISEKAGDSSIVPIELTNEEVEGIRRLSMVIVSRKIENNDLRAISIHAPYAYAICLGRKQYEYRTRDTKHRGWVLIHSSMSKESDEHFQKYGIDKSTVKRGCIIGSAKITYTVKFVDGYGYRMETPLLFSEALPIKGKQAILWKPADNSERLIFEKCAELINGGSNDQHQ